MGSGTLTGAKPHDQAIFEHNAWHTGKKRSTVLCGAQIEIPIVPKAQNRFAGFRIECNQLVTVRVDHALVFAVLPPH